jgi:hypothetical protein
MKRREFLGMAATSTAGLVLPAAARISDHASPALPHSSLLATFHDAGIVRAIGCRYRELTPAENNAALLAEAILGEEPLTPSAALSARLAGQVRRDFADGRTVMVNGWVLSVTEARQCALYSLQNP